MSFLYGAAGGGVVGVLLVILAGCCWARIARSIAERDRLREQRLKQLETQVADHIRSDRSQEILTKLESMELLIIGRLTYKSRKVGIPADQKVPTTGNFKSTRTKSLFGTEEHIIEYDFTAGSDADAAAARKALESKVQQSLSASSLKD